jgi:hypothetical protein
MKQILLFCFMILACALNAQVISLTTSTGARGFNVDEIRMVRTALDGSGILSYGNPLVTVFVTETPAAIVTASCNKLFSVTAVESVNGVNTNVPMVVNWVLIGSIQANLAGFAVISYKTPPAINIVTNQSYATVAALADDCPGGGGGSGTVTTVGFTNANGVSGVVTNPTTTPNLTLTLGAITPTSINGATISTSETTFMLSGAGKIVDVVGNATISGVNSGDVSLAGENYLSRAGQVVTANPVDLSGSNVTGTLKTSSTSALTGDVTKASGNLNTTINVGAVTGTKLAADAVVDSTKVGANAIQSSDIASGQVWNRNLAGSAVDSTKIAARAVQSSDIGVGAVWATNIAANAVDSTKVKSRSISGLNIALNTVANGNLVGDITLSKLGQSGATSNQVPQWNGSAWVPATVGGGGSYTSGDGIFISGANKINATGQQSLWNAIKYIRINDTIPARGLSANEFVANYPVTDVDSSYYKFTNASVGGQRGGWLANGTSNDSIAVSAPFGVLIGDSQAAGRPGLWGRLQPNGASSFNWNYPDSVGQISFRLRQLTGMRWYNHGIGGQTSLQVLSRCDRDLLGLVSTPILGADGRGTKTLNRKPSIAVVIVGINDVFTAGFNADITENNIYAICKKSSENGIYTIALTLPGDALITTPAQSRYINEVNAWMKAGGLNNLGVVVVDYNTWWKNPTYNDNSTGNAYIVDDIHPSKVGYDSLSVFIFNQAKIPTIRKVIVSNELAPSGGLTGFSRPNNVNFGNTTYSIANSIDSFSLTKALVTDSVFMKINSSTNVTGTTYSGFSDIRYVLSNQVSNLYKSPRVIPSPAPLALKAAGTSPSFTTLSVVSSTNRPFFGITQDGSVYNLGKGSVSTNTVFGQEAFGNSAGVTGANNTGMGQYPLYALTTGTQNVGIGNRAGFGITTASNNSLLGYFAGNKITTGGGHTVMGSQALANITTASSCTAIGSSALSLCTAAENTAVGESALFALTTGTQNVASANLSLFNATTGNRNSAFGYRALLGLTTTSGTTGIGYRAGTFIADGTTSLTTPTNCTFIGGDTKGSANGITNETVIGFNAIGNGSNTVTIGSSAVTSNVFYGKLGVNGLPAYTGDFIGTDGVRITTGTTGQRGTAAAGVIRHNTDLNKFEGSGTGATYYPFDQTLYSATANTTVTNTTVVSNLASVSIPANSLAVGQTINVNLAGYINTDAIAPGNGRIGIVYGTDTIYSAVAAIQPISGGNIKTFIVQFSVRVVASGATGALRAQGFAQMQTDLTTLPYYGGWYPFSAPTIANTTVNTTTAKPFSVFWQFGTADPDNGVAITSGTILRQ